MVPAGQRAMPIRLDSRSADFAARFAAFLATKREASRGRRAGGARHHRRRARARRRALVELTRKFDRVDLDAVGAARDARPRSTRRRRLATRDALDALTLARDRIEAYHRRQMPKDDRYTDALGVELG